MVLIRIGFSNRSIYVCFRLRLSPIRPSPTTTHHRYHSPLIAIHSESFSRRIHQRSWSRLGQSSGCEEERRGTGSTRTTKQDREDDLVSPRPRPRLSFFSAMCFWEGDSVLVLTRYTWFLSQNQSTSVVVVGSVAVQQPFILLVQERRNWWRGNAR